MKNDWRFVPLALLLVMGLCVLAAGCSGSSDKMDDTPAVLPTAAVLSPSAPGTATQQNDSALIDYSNASDGYVMVKWIAGGNDRIAVQVKGPTNPEAYTYYLPADASFAALPLSDGDGTYQLQVCRNISGTKYSQALSLSLDVRLTDPFAPFLRPNQYVDFSASSQTVDKARELAAGAKSALDIVQAVYDWVVGNITYDYEKAATVQTGYLPDVDRTLREKTGICFDYAALMSAMLRSQGVPVKLVVGYTSKGEYHAWISVWTVESGWIDGIIQFDGNVWKLMDPTFASNDHQSKSIMEYIANPANYKERFVY